MKPGGSLQFWKIIGTNGWFSLILIFQNKCVCYEISWLFSDDGLWKIIWLGVLPSSLYVFS
jgi:hypothetical protein